MPKDEPPQPAAARKGGLARFLGLDGGGGSNAFGDLGAMHEDLFRIRGHLAQIRADLDHVRSAVGRRDVTALDELIQSGNRRDIEATIRDRSQTVPLPDGSVLCRILGRYKFHVDAADTGMAPHLLLDGYWQYWVTEFIARNLARGEQVVEVGAQYGYFSVVMADLIGPGGRLLTLEPNPWLHWLCGRNLAINGSSPPATLQRTAAGFRAEAATRLRARITGPFHGPFATWFEYGEGGASVQAPSVALDDLEQGPVDLIKINTGTNAELIWLGAQALLDRSPDVRVLLHFQADACHDPQGFVAAMAARFPLRIVGTDSRALPVTEEALLGEFRDCTVFLAQGEAR